MAFKRTLLLLFIVAFWADESYSQISGQILDSVTGQGISDANISIPGTTIGSSSGRDGFFRLEWYTFPVRIQVSAIGYSAKTVTVFESRSSISIELDPVVYMSEEVTVAHDRIDISNTRTRPIPVTHVPVDGELIRLNTTGAELLRSEKGVYVQQTTPGQGSIYIRGRAGRDVLYLFNGLRINPSFVRSGQNQYFGAIDPFSTDQINVFRGPISVYHGSDALSGGLNVVPIILPFEEENRWSGRVLSQFNFNGTGEQTLHSSVGFQSNSFTWYLSGTYRDYRYYKMSSKSDPDLWFPYDNHINNADFRYLSYLSSMRYRINSRNQLSFVSFVGAVPDAPRLDQMIMGFSRQVDANITAPSAAYSSNTSPLVLSAHSIDFKSSVQQRWLSTVGIKLGYHTLGDNRLDIAFDDTPNFLTGDKTFTLSDFEQVDQNRSAQILGSVDLMATPFRSTILRLGGDVSSDYVTSSRFIRNTQTGEETSRLSRYPDGSRYTQTGLFLHGTQTLVDQLWVEGGLRYSYIFTDLALEGTNSERGFDAYSTSFQYTTGSVGLTWSPTTHLYLTSNISTGFRAPNIADLTELGERRSRFMQVPNPNLRPEHTFNTDISIRWINDIMNFELTGYRVKYSDKIESVQTGNIILADAGNNETRELLEVMNRNENHMILYGIESNLDFRVSAQTRAGFVFNYTFGELEERNGTKSPVDRIPPANGQLYVRHAVTDGLTLGSQIRYALAHTRLSDAELQDFRVSNEGTDGYAVVQAFGRWHLQEHSEFDLILDNAFDVAYREHASSLDGLGRNITIAYRYRW